MELNQYLSTLLFILSTVQWKILEACTCQLRHPQQHYCNADFVILATPKFVNGDKTVYKLKIRNEFKMTEKAKLSLKSGRLVTQPVESLCGVNLSINDTYVIAGNIMNLEANINLCNSYVKLWKDVTPRQRKGFKVLYARGCECKIKPCFNLTICAKMKTMQHTCKWLTNPRCQSDFGICHANKMGKCDWAMARKLTTCLRENNLPHHLRPIRRRSQPILRRSQPIL